MSEGNLDDNDNLPGMEGTIGFVGSLGRRNDGSLDPRICVKTKGGDYYFSVEQARVFANELLYTASEIQADAAFVTTVEMMGVTDNASITLQLRVFRESRKNLQKVTNHE